MSSSSSRTITLKSSDGQDLEIEETAAQLSLTIKQTIEQDPSKTIIPIPAVNGNTLSKIIDYCKKHATDKDNEEALKLFDVELVNEMNEVTMSYMSDSARAMRIKSLHVLVSTALRARLRGKSVEEMFKMFSIDDIMKLLIESIIHTVLDDLMEHVSLSVKD